MTFGKPHILYALVLVLIPVLVHLLRLQRYRKQVFPDVSFLEQIERQSRRSQRLKRYLLLLSRILFIVFLVLAMARPRFSAGAEPVRGRTYLYIDRSPSGQYPVGGRPAFELLKSQAGQVLAGRRQWYWLTEDEAPRALPAEELRRRLADLHTGCLPDRPRTVWQRIKARDSVPGEIYWFTDGQHVDSVFLAKLDTAWRYRFYVARPGGWINTVVDSLWMTGITAQGRQMACRLRRFGPAVKQRLSVHEGSKVVYTQSVRLEEDAIDTLYFVLPREMRRGYIRLEGDPYLPWDNQLFFTLPAQEPKRILVVGRGKSPFWQPLFDAGGHRVDYVTPAAIPYESGDVYDLIIFEGWAPSLDRRAVDARFPSAVKVFVPVLKPAADRDFWRQWAGNEPPLAQSGSWAVSGIPWGHPFFRGVIRRPREAIRAPHVTKAYDLSGRPAGEVLLRLENRWPFLIRRGRWYAFTAPLGGKVSDFYLSPLMTAVFYRLLSGTRPAGQLYELCRPGLQVAVPARGTGDVPVEWRGAAVRMIPYQQYLDGKWVLYPDLSRLRPGLYALVRGKDTLQWIALNADRTESLPPRAPADVRVPHIRWTLLDGNTAPSAPAHKHWSPALLFLLLALLFLAAEMAMIRLWKN